MPSPPESPPAAPVGQALDRPALLAALRARVARLDQGGPRPGSDSLRLCDAMDRCLPGGGLARAALHEVLAADPDAAAGFCGLLLARSGGTVLWIAAGEAWPPGLTRFGLSPAELVLVRAPRREDALWAMEEGLRCRGIAGALLATEALDQVAMRRLQVAAEAGGAIGLLLCPEEAAEPGATAALTRWRVGALAGGASGTGGAADLGDPRWRLDLLRGRGARPQHWEVVWRPAAERLDLDDAGAEAEAGPVAVPARARRHGAASAGRAPSVGRPG